MDKLGNTSTQKYEIQQRMQRFVKVLTQTKGNRETRTWRNPTPTRKRTHHREVWRERVIDSENDRMCERLHSIMHEDRKKTTSEFTTGWRIGKGGTVIDCYKTSHNAPELFNFDEKKSRLREKQNQRLQDRNAFLKSFVDNARSHYRVEVLAKDFDKNRASAKALFTKMPRVTLHIGLLNGAIEANIAALPPSSPKQRDRSQMNTARSSPANKQLSSRPFSEDGDSPGSGRWNTTRRLMSPERANVAFSSGRPDSADRSHRMFFGADSPDRPTLKALSRVNDDMSPEWDTSPANRLSRQQERTLYSSAGTLQPLPLDTSTNRIKTAIMRISGSPAASPHAARSSLFSPGPDRRAGAVSPKSTASGRPTSAPSRGRDRGKQQEAKFFPEPRSEDSRGDSRLRSRPTAVYREAKDDDQLDIFSTPQHPDITVMDTTNARDVDGVLVNMNGGTQSYSPDPVTSFMSPRERILHGRATSASAPALSPLSGRFEESGRGSYGGLVLVQQPGAAIHPAESSDQVYSDATFAVPRPSQFQTRRNVLMEARALVRVLDVSAEVSTSAEVEKVMYVIRVVDYGEIRPTSSAPDMVGLKEAFGDAFPTSSGVIVEAFPEEMAAQVEEEEAVRGGAGLQDDNEPGTTATGRCAVFIPMKHLRRLAHSSGLKGLATTLRHMRSVDRVNAQYACISAHLDSTGEKDLCELLLKSVDVVRFSRDGELGDAAVRLVVDQAVIAEGRT